jgi:beta-glucanase (GH16 family)
VEGSAAHTDKMLSIAQVLVLASATAFAAQLSGGPPFDPSEWVADFVDEFQGTALNASKWTAKTGPHVSAEGEYYLPSSVSVQGGSLVLTADRSADPSKTGGLHYTSGWIDAQDKWSAVGGRFEASCKFYVGASGRSLGMWPAFWLMPQGGACWPVSGEIDVMESLGGAAEPYKGKAIGEQESHWALHWADSSRQCGSDQSAGNWAPPLSLSAPLYNESFAVFGLNWDAREDTMTFYVNERTIGSFSGFNQSVDQVHPFYPILNLAVGGPWGGFPDSSTVFPQYMMCDWVRHYSFKG